MHRGIGTRLVCAAFHLALAFTASAVHAATITVTSLADDIFPDGFGAIFDANGSPLPPPATPHCTLRMAIAAANLDLAIGGANGCASGAGADTIVFDAALNLANVPGKITIASKAMSEAPATYSPPNTSALAVSRPLTITGPGSDKLVLDGTATAVDGRRMLVVSDGNQDTDGPITINGLRFANGRTIDTSSGCMFSSESTTLNDVGFEHCESVGGPTNAGFGGALGLGNLLAGALLPTISIQNSFFVANRTLRGTSTLRAEIGGVFIGSATRKVGAVTIGNSVFAGNLAERVGGLFIDNAASVTISGTLFAGNQAGGDPTDPTITNGPGNGRYGGFEVINVSGNVTINNATRVQSNVAAEERGGFGVLTVGGTTTIDNVDVMGNYVANGRIGGFEVLTDNFDASGNCLGTSLHPVIVNNVRVVGNSVASNIGGFRVQCSGALTMTDSLVSRNETRGYQAVPVDTVSTFASAGFLGPATDATAAQSTAVLTRVAIRENSTRATAAGGGSNVLQVVGLGAFTADSVRVSANNAAAVGGGLTLSGRGAGRQYLVVNSDISGNTASDGPALFMATDGAYTLRNSTVSQNTTTGAGGGTVRINANTNIAGAISLAIEQSTIARNTSNATEAVGVFVAANQPNPGVTTNTLFGGGNASIAFRNSILAPRSQAFTGVNAVGFDPTVTAITATNSLLEYSGGAPAGFCSGAGMKCDVGALVANLADNGNGSPAVTLRTMALMAGSPAIDAGGPVPGGLTTDERGTGFPRVIGPAVDMGAYEASAASTVGCTIDIDGNGTADALTDGLIFIRAMFGLTGTPVTNGTIGSGATRSTWAQIRSYLNGHCGTSFAP